MLARARIRPLFIRYAAPGVVAMLFLAFQSIVDGLIVGRLIGANALAAVSCFHMEVGNMKSLCSNNRKTRIGISEH